MIVSTKGRYALRVMIDLSEHQSEKYVPLKEIAARQEISEKYLENILKVLVQNRGRDPDADRGQPCAGELPDPQCDPLLPHGKLPHLRDVEGAGRSDLQLFRQYHTGRSRPA